MHLPCTHQSAVMFLSCISDTKGWGSSIARHTNAASLAAPRRGLSAAAPPSMSLMLLAEVEDAATAAADMPVSLEQQESIISVLSVVSSALLLIIIGGAGEMMRCCLLYGFRFMLSPYVVSSGPLTVPRQVDLASA